MPEVDQRDYSTNNNNKYLFVLTLQLAPELIMVTKVNIKSWGDSEDRSRKIPMTKIGLKPKIFWSIILISAPT